jgi:undecaprenyl phosphate-alpha-L-ara4N flippase subunit ArnE
MKTKLWAIMLMVLCTVFTSIAQIFYKIGADKLRFDIISILTNWQLIFGMILYILGAILVIIALRGGEVTVLYPIITSSYIWVSLGSVYFFGEKMNSFKWIGVFLIILGIIIITFGQKDKEVIEFTEAV